MVKLDISHVLQSIRRKLADAACPKPAKQRNKPPPVICGKCLRDGAREHEVYERKCSGIVPALSRRVDDVVQKQRPNDHPDSKLRRERARCQPGRLAELLRLMHERHISPRGCVVVDSSREGCKQRDERDGVE